MIPHILLAEISYKVANFGSLRGVWDIKVFLFFTKRKTLTKRKTIVILDVKFGIRC